MPRTVLFLCTGNYYRSRFAEMWFNHLATERRIDWIASSRGLATETNHLLPGVISPLAVEALAARGVKLPDPHRNPASCQHADFEQADRVIALKGEEHLPLMRARHPDWAERIEYWDIHDINVAPAEQMLAEIDRRVRALVDELAGSAEPRSLR